MLRRFSKLFSGMFSKNSARRPTVTSRRPNTFRPTLEDLEAREVMSVAPLSVVGNHLENPSGNLVVLRGVNAGAGLESWPSSLLPSDAQGNPQIKNLVDEEVKQWHANLLRVTIYQDYWFGQDQGAIDGNGNSLGVIDPTAYRNLVKQIVQTAEADGAYVMLAEWGSDMNSWGAAPALHDMPDYNTEAFWKDVATAYKNDPGVLFDPFNEPHNVSWDQWLNGGTISENGTTYDSPGMQEILKTIRDTGADNIVSPEGLGWATQASGLSALKDSANQLMFQFHLYPDDGQSSASWDADVSPVASQYPIYIGEWGTTPDGTDAGADGVDQPGLPSAGAWSQAMLKWLDQPDHQYSWTAWEFNPPQNGGPNLISDWNYTPTDYFGTYVQQNLAQHANDVPTPPPGPGPGPGPAGADVTSSFTDTNDWGTGFTGSITMTNLGTSDVNGWTLDFDFTGNITDIWDGQIVSHVGDHYVIQNVSWDTTIGAGQSVSFGFNADWADPQAAPTNFVVNGAADGTPAPANAAPTVATAAQASAAAVTGTTTNLSVLGADDGGHANLTYTWATTGTPPAPVTFSANGSNAAQDTTVTFSKAGTYNFVVTITDAGGLSTTSAVTVTVNQTLTKVAVSPAQGNVAAGGSQQFTATALDQFGDALAKQPAFTWSVAAGHGTVSSSGLYKAPASAGSATVKATTAAVSGTSTVTVTSPVSAAVSFANTQDWGTGFTGYLTMSNRGSSVINGWTLQFDFSGNITDIWDGQIVSHVGTHYVIQNVSWDATIAAGQSVNFGFNADWGTSHAAPTNYLINGVAAKANAAPTVATAARASSSSVAGTTTNLSVLGADDGGQANLTYTWATTGNAPAPVTFSANGSNAAKSTTATFSQAGTYRFVVTITDAGSLSITSTVTVTVSQKLTKVTVSPAQGSVAAGGSQQFTATALDQFGNALAKQPAFTWSVAGSRGTISSSGLYKAPASAGSATIKATAGSVSGTSTVTVTSPVSAAVSFADTDDWGTGFTGYLTMTNNAKTAINGWTLQFDFTGNITDIWDGQIVSHVGTHYVIQNVSWDATIAAGQSVNFGFNADWGTAHTAPTNFVLNGMAVKGS